MVQSGNIDYGLIMKALNSDPVGASGNVDYGKLASSIFTSYFAKRAADVIIFQNDGGNAVAINSNGQVVVGPSTDHGSVIQDAIDGIDGGLIYISTGKYNIQKSIIINNKKISMVGASPSATKLVCDFADDCIKVGSDTSTLYAGIDNLVIANINIYGKDPDQSWADNIYSYGSGIHIIKANNPLIYNVNVWRKYRGIYLDRQNSLCGLYNTTLERIRLYYNVFGIGLNDPRMVHIRDVWGYLNQYSLIGGSIDYGLFMRDVTAEADGWNYAQNEGQVVGLSCVGACNMYIENLYINGSKAGGLSPTKQLLQIIVNDGSQVHIRGMTLQSGNHYGANIWGGGGDYDILVTIEDFLIGPLKFGFMGDPGTVNDWGLRIAVNNGIIKLRDGYLNSKYGINLALYKHVELKNVMYKGNPLKLRSPNIARGKATLSGDGTSTQFTIAHGLPSKPNNVIVTPCSIDAAGNHYVTADSTNIYVNYVSAPPVGTDNVCLNWYAEI